MFCVGMQEAEIQRIADASGFIRGTLPFVYLGVPIYSRKLPAREGKVLVEKMTSRIQQWKSNNLSYAGRLILVNVVLLAIHVYWAQIMPLPKGILKEILAVCRAFLWTSSAMFDGPGKVAWDAVCRPKSEGGLGIKDIRKWNQDALFKHAWAVEHKKDILWVRWVNHVYMKGRSFWDITPTANCSWYWKKILEVRDMFAEKGDLEKFKKGSTYKIQDGYRYLVGIQRRDRRYTQVWNRMNVPKHSFILWLAVQGRLMTKDRAARFMIIQKTGCEFCRNAEETSQHLFFQCCVIKEWLQEIKIWLGWRTYKTEMQELLLWMQRTKLSRFKRKIWLTAMASLVYTVWFQRNRKVLANEGYTKNIGD